MFFFILIIFSKSILLRFWNLFHRNLAIISFILIFFFFSTVKFTKASQTSKPDPEIEYGWIEYLFNQGETALAINEGLRFIYFYPTHKLGKKL